MRKWHPNTVLGALAVVFALVLALLWTPMDTDTGIVEASRGKFIIGDGMAPTFASAVFAIAGLLLIVGPKPGDAPVLQRATLIFLGSLIGICFLSLLIMRWAGPLAVSLVGAEDYRLLRDTLPWKYIGFVIGGFLMVSGLVSLIERRVTWQALATGLIAVVAIVLLYDLPFEDLLLPPNGDV